MNAENSKPALVAQQHTFDIHPALQEHIDALNEAAITLWLTASRLCKIAPLAGAFVGLSDEALEALSHVKKADLIRAARIGPALAIPRFTDAATIRAMLSSGFATSTVMAEMNKTMPLTTLEKKRRIG